MIIIYSKKINCDGIPTLNLNICVAYPSSQGNKWRLRLVQFNGLFNNPRALPYTSTKRREGINPNENALQPQLIQSQLHIIQVH